MAQATPPPARKKPAAKRPASRSGPSSKPRPRRSGKRGGGWRWPLRPLFLLLLLLASLAAFFYLIFLHQPGLPPPVSRPEEQSRPTVDERAPPLLATPAKRKAGEPEAASEASAPDQGTPPVAGSDTLPPTALSGRPQIAIVIDDMGYRREAGLGLLALDMNLSFSFLPFSPHVEELLPEARRRGREILLHLPLEAENGKWNSDPGLLRLSMSEPELAALFAADLAEVAGAVGINNHMGSRFTEDAAAMDVLLGLIKAQNIFFLDSLTSPRSVGREAAARHGVPFLKRHIFLDNDQEADKIGRQLEVLVKIAEKQGWAVGIGHSYPATLAALAAARGGLEGRVEVVRLSQLVAAYGQPSVGAPASDHR